ncbi:response regulator [Pseudoalteromonas sp. SSDWG2]|uniref:response regulator n=1 Tax=Pseudoalteromonas sp. SSDWG2 TaxID=3139391 RepID=UPI003BAAAE47
MSNIRIAVADDHPLIVFAIEQTLMRTWQNLEIESAHCYHQLFRLIEQHKSQLALLILDLSMPGSEGVQGLEYICTNYPDIPVVVISGHDDFESCTKCLNAGAQEFISKTEVADVITNVVARYLGKDNAKRANQSNKTSADDTLQSLTPSQQKVLLLIAKGLRNKAIARELGISEKTVRVHASRIFKQLGVENRTEAAMKLKRTPEVI